MSWNKHSCHVLWLYLADRCCSHAEWWRTVCLFNTQAIICYLYTFLLLFSLTDLSGCDPAGLSWDLGPVLLVQLGPGLVSMMGDHLPPVLLETCVVVGASSDKLNEVYKVCASKRTPAHVWLMCFKLKIGTVVVSSSWITCVCSPIPACCIDIFYIRRFISRFITFFFSLTRLVQLRSRISFSRET